MVHKYRPTTSTQHIDTDQLKKNILDEQFVVAGHGCMVDVSVLHDFRLSVFLFTYSPVH